MKVTKKLTSLIPLMLILSSVAFGQSKAPAVAIKACEGKNSGDVSEFTGPRGETVKGTCKDVDGKLVLQPDSLKGKPPAGPPPEAIKACKGKVLGDVSEFTGLKGNTVKGICKDVDGKLVLQPDRPKGKKVSGPPPEAIKACEGKSSGDVSEFTGPRGETVGGTCKEVDGKLVLQPDRSTAK